MYGQLSGDAFGGMNQQRGFPGFPQELLGGGFGAPRGGLPQQGGFGGLPQQGLPRGPGGFGLPQQQPQMGGFGAPPPMQQHLPMPGLDPFGGFGGGFGGPPQQLQRGPSQQQQQRPGAFGQQKGGGGQQQQRPPQQQRSGGGGGFGGADAFRGFPQQQMPLAGGQANFKGGKDTGGFNKGFNKGEKGTGMGGGGGGGGGGGKGKRQSDKGGTGAFPPQQQFQPPPVPGVNANGTANWSYGQTAKGAPLLPADGMKGMKGGKGMPSMMPYGKGGESLDTHSNVFVGNLQESITQAQLEAAFSAFGVVQSVLVAAKEGRTYGFVKFASMESATRAIAGLSGQNGWVVKMANKDMGSGENFGKGGFGKGDGKPSVFSNSKPTHTNVFVGSLKDGLTNAQLEKVFKSYGTVDSCVVMDKEGKTYGFVEFSTIAEAQAAIEGMNGQEGLVVKFSNNDNVPMSWEDSIPHSNLFIGSLPQDMTEGKLRGICERHGSVQSCSLRTDAEAGKCFGFVKFNTIAAARRAIKALNDTDGWSVKCANNDVAGAGGKGAPDGKGMFGGKGFFGFPFPFGKGGKGGGWVWTNQTENDRPEPEPHDNLYIKNLPPGIKEEEVISTFGTEGDVVECRVLNWDGVSECAALVRMATVEQATSAKEKYNGKVHEKCRQTLSVALQQKSGSSVEDHIYVKGLHCTTTQEQLKEVFGTVGEIKWSRILPMPFWPTPGKLAEGTALVQYATPAEAEAAVAKFDGTVSDEVGLKMSVRYAEEKAADRPEVKPNSNVYVKGWPVGFPDFLLQSIFQKFGTVMRLRLLDNPDPEQPTQAALVQMAREEEATAALKALHGQVAATPVPAMRVKHAGRDGKPSGNLYVTALPRVITEQQIRETFKKYGEVSRLRLLNQEKSPELRALVELSSPQLAQQAVRELDNSAPVFTGPMLYIQYASKREGGKGGRKGE
mmetsp:Transcript_13464/g.21224  ORF Transcript_13464/g.21224 Transcript_13464/m.21224 type:complete len:948 (+) Transcript_13464:94-2937(+)